VDYDLLMVIKSP